MKYEIKSSFRKQRIIAGRVDVSGGTPAVGAGAGFTVADTAAGKVTVTLDEPGKSIVCAVATAIEGTDATGHSVKVDGAPSDGASVVFGIYAADGTDGVLVDNVAFYFQIIAQDVSI